LLRSLRWRGPSGGDRIAGRIGGTGQINAGRIGGNRMRPVSLDEGIPTSLRELKGWQNLDPMLSVPTYRRSLLLTPEEVSSGGRITSTGVLARLMSCGLLEHSQLDMVACLCAELDTVSGAQPRQPQHFRRAPRGSERQASQPRRLRKPVRQRFTCKRLEPIRQLVRKRWMILRMSN
jgi:hypothetical protein